MGKVRRFCLGVFFSFGGGLALVAVAACTDVASYDQNASTPGQPPDGFPRSETRLGFLPTVGPDGLVGLVYNDFSGFFSGVAEVLPRPNLNGYSYSTNAGQTWTRGLLPLDPACDVTLGTCVAGMAGNPWIAFDRNVLLYYSSLGGTRIINPTDPAKRGLPFDAVVVGFSANGVAWTYPRVAALTLDHDTCDPIGFCQTVDKPSLDAVPSATVVAYLLYAPALASDALWLSTSDFGGAWHQQELTFSPSAPQLPPGYVFQNPIVRLVDARTGFLAWLERPRLPVGVFDYYIRVARIARTTGDWVGTVIYQNDNVQLFPFADGANGTQWRDNIPVSFDIGNVGNPLGPHLYVAFRKRERRALDSLPVSQVHVDDCPAASQCSVNAGWRDTNFYSVVGASGDQLQPNVSAFDGNESVAIVWYQQLSAGFGEFPLPDARQTVFGTYSTDGLNTRGFRLELQLPAPIRYHACPTTQYYWGDYFDSLLIQNRTYHADIPGFNLPITTPWIVTAHADSRGGCELQGPTVARDQHVEAVVW